MKQGNNECLNFAVIYTLSVKRSSRQCCHIEDLTLTLNCDVLASILHVSGSIHAIFRVICILQGTITSLETYHNFTSIFNLLATLTCTFLFS
jgi:hypothetical protein